MSKTMRCPRVLQLIDDHVDGLLPAREAEDVRDHLDRCRDCRDTAVAAKAASTSLAVWGDLEPPRACFDQILAKIDALPPEALARPVRRTVRPAPLRFLRWAGPSLTAAAAVVAAFVWTERGTASDPHAHGAGPVTAASVARTAARAAAAQSAPGTGIALRDGEEYIRLDAGAWARGLRRTRREEFPRGQVRDGALFVPAIFASPR